MEKKKRVIVIGATSGIGREVALQMLRRGWLLGVAGRREEALEELREAFPELVVASVIDVTQPEAAARLMRLIEARGGMDLFFLASGTGRQNLLLDEAIELQTAETNVTGFIRMVTAAFRYFASTGGGGHIAVISSIAGTRGMGSAPAYSATKRLQNTYMDALAQLSHIRKTGIRVTDIRPGFVDTPLLKHGDYKYPMLMRADRVAAVILRAIDRRKRVIVIDRRFRALVILWRMLPQWLWERLHIG
jgi:short-subunit dehydrogenase